MTTISNLPLSMDVETKAVLRASAKAHRFLAELKGGAATIPNQGILIDTLGLQEAKDSSEIEAIITTHDDLFRAGLIDETSPATKEVRRYAQVLRLGFESVLQTGLIRDSDIRDINRGLTLNEAGYRRLPGTALKNDQTGEVVYTPPQDATEIRGLMANLVEYINDPNFSDLDPLVKMAIIHHQFESIHPFYDGNGRTGRIINILYLVAQGLLGIPVLYLSRYIVRNKSEYYRLLQETREHKAWEDWILFMLEGVAQTARATLNTVRDIRLLMLDTKHRLRSEAARLYSQDLLNNLFRHPYTKIEFVMSDLEVSRPTASKYLQMLVQKNFLVEQKIGRSKFFINMLLFDLLLGVERTLEEVER